ncbi:hypothetical protein SAMN02990966_06110 [Rhodospirillales bacterium URHD0017]|nr:hypothetical protein SAMN02990966_06110 [Rhodospirillales bacterium URHD0017]
MRFRELAAEARQMAEQASTPGALTAMTEVAETWDRLAHLEETDLERKTGYSSG